jgi:HSP20 family protein
MSLNKQTALTSSQRSVDPFALLGTLTSELDRAFDEPFGLAPRWFSSPAMKEFSEALWSPEIDVFERDNRLVTKVDLPGLGKDDVKVEVADGYLAISGERKSESEETKDNVYRRERAHGNFYRAVVMPEGVKPEDVLATFADGVLEVSVPIPKRPAAEARKIEVKAAKKP